MNRCDPLTSPARLHANRILALFIAAGFFLNPFPVRAAGVPEDAVSPHFESVAKHLDLGGTMFAYIDIDGDIDSLASKIRELLKSQGAPPEIANIDLVKGLRTLGVSQVSAIGLSSYQRGVRFHNKAFLHIPGGREGIFKAFGGEPGPLLARKIAPADTDLIIEQDLDLKNLIEAIRNALNGIGAQEMVREMDAAMGQSFMGPITMGDFVERGPAKVTLIVRIDREKRTLIPDGPEIPAADILIAVDGMGWILRRFKALVPPEALAKVYIDGDGFEAFVAPEPAPAPFGRYLPYAYVADGDDRLYIASRKEFLDECLAADGAISDSEDFQLATAGLPTEGNALSYISPDVTAEFRQLIRESGFKMGATELMIIESLGGEMTAELKHGIAHVSSNLPDGILWTSNSITSHKSSLLTIPIVPIAIVASFAVPVFNKVVGKAQDAKNMNSAKQLLLGAHLHATDSGGKFPDDLEKLVGDYIQPGANLDWMNPETKTTSPWDYYGKRIGTDSPATLMLLSSPQPVGGSRIVGFADGSVQSVPENRYQALKDELEEYRKKNSR